MAAIPTYLYLGDQTINGASVSNLQTNISSLWGLGLMTPLFNRIVPSGPDGATGGTYNPYWDGLSGIPYSATSATSTTITVSSATWTTDQFFGKTIIIDTGLGAAQTRTVASNTPTTITVTSAWTTTPDATSAFHVRTGRFVTYHYASQLFLGPTALGDNWYQSGSGITPCTMLMQMLSNLHGNTSPGFRMLKQALNGGFGSGATPWKPTSSGWTTFLAQWNAAVAAAAADGDTLDVRAVIMDCSSTDIANVNLLYQVHAQEWIDGMRALVGDDALILLVDQHPYLYSGSLPPVSTAVRNLNRALRLANDNVRLFDMSWGTLAGDTGIAFIDATDPAFFSAPTYIQAGVRLYNAIQSFYAALPAADDLAPLAGYFMIGDSEFVTAGIYNDIAKLGLQTSVLGPDELSFIRPYVWIYDVENDTVAPFDITSNSNTYGTVTTSFMGPDVTFPTKLLAAHPNGVVLFKYAKGGVGLTLESVTAGTTGALEPGQTIYEDIRAKFALFRAACLRDLGRSVDMLGGLVGLGDNEMLSDESSAAFQTKAAQFVDDLRDVFTTRASGSELAIAWLQPPPHAETTTGGSTLGTASRRASVRATVAALSTAKTRVAVLLNSGPDDYELQRTDFIHYGGRAIYDIGDDAATALLALESDEGETSTTTSTVSESAAFVVEDGSGLSSANSYCSVATADTYHEQFGNPLAWSTLTTAQKQDYLRTATRAADERYGSRWYGFRADDDQALDWPRSGVQNRDGIAIDEDIVPSILQYWTARAALMLQQGEDLSPESQTAGSIQSESLSSPSGASKSVTYRDGGKPAAARYPALDRMLANAGFIAGSAGWGSMGV